MYNIDFDLFKQEIDNIEIKLKQIKKNEIIDHFNKINIITHFFYFIGLFTLFIDYKYVISWLFLSLGIFAKWTIIGHHICHGGYDFVDKKYNKRLYGQKTLYRRVIDWFDWWIIESWNIEHNNLHHYYLGEQSDPDLTERNLSILRDSNLPYIVKKLILFISAFIWKWFYYAPNTYKYYCLNKFKMTNIDKYNKISTETLYSPFTIMPYILNNKEWMGNFFVNVLFPYILYMYCIIPLFWSVIFYVTNTDITNIYNVYINILLAELLTNLHSFIIIIPNHSGDDIYRFNTHVTPKSGEFYLRQIISSVNYTSGNDFIDFLHGWLNYQIEHHIYPDMSLLQYRYAQPLIKQLCKKYNIEYIQDNVFVRLNKAIDIMIGKTSMKIFK